MKGLRPPFIRWPGGSYASIYKWKDGIGPPVKRKFNPNTIWGGYSDYYGFGTDEFMELCRQLGSQPMIVLGATNTDPAQFEYAMDWVHYLLDPATTQWGRQRAANGHAEPYQVPYFQIDNEPMNHGLKPDEYAAIVNLYGKRLRQIAPHPKIVACGQKRSNDINWSQKLIDIWPAAISTSLVATITSTSPKIMPPAFAGLRITCKRSAITFAAPLTPISSWLCWNGDSAALTTGGPECMPRGCSSPSKISARRSNMACPALLMRNTTDDPEWRAWIYHDHVSWFAGSGYVAEKLFRDYYAPQRFASTSGTFKDIPKRSDFFDNISQMKPEGWTPDTLDAIATGTADGRRIIIKAVNYAATPNTLLTRLQGKQAPANATVTIITLTARPEDENSLADPNRIHPVQTAMRYSRDMAVKLPPYTVAVVEIRGD